jgi:hypothetical protein
MPTFGKKSTVEETMAALEGPLVRFHEACGGDLEDVSVLFRAMSGQSLPPPVLCQLMGVSAEEMQGASRENPIRLSAAQLLGGVAAAMDENDTAAMYVDKIEACIDGVKQRDELRKLRAAITLDEAAARDIEARLLAGMKSDTEMLAHLAGLRDLHDKWRANTDDTSDAARFPTIVVGPQILSFEPISMMHHSKVLGEAEREQFLLRPGEDGVGILREKLAPLRKASAEVADAQRQRIAWLATQATGVQVDAGVLGDSEWVAALDAKLAADISAPDFQQKIDDILGDVKLGPSSVRIDAVEAEISQAMGRAGAALPVPITGYEMVVAYACLRALTEEVCAGDLSGSPIASSLQAVKSTRRKIGDRFFRKQWLPLESNPDVFNSLGQQVHVLKRCLYVCMYRYVCMYV